MIATAQILPTERFLWEGKSPKLHIQHPEREVTLCGLSLTKMELDFCDDDDLSLGCKKCWVIYQRNTQATPR